MDFDRWQVEPTVIVGPADANLESLYETDRIGSWFIGLIRPGKPRLGADWFIEALSDLTEVRLNEDSHN